MIFQFSLALSDMVLAFATALALYLMIEAPFRKVFRELMFPSKDTTPKVTDPAGVEENNMMNNNNICQDSRL